MMSVSKVNIDELVDVLLDLRKDGQFVDITITEGNIIRVKRHMSAPPPEDDTSLDLNQLIA